MSTRYFGFLTPTGPERFTKCYDQLWCWSTFQNDQQFRSTDGSAWTNYPHGTTNYAEIEVYSELELDEPFMVVWNPTTYAPSTFYRFDSDALSWTSIGSLTWPWTRTGYWPSGIPEPTYSTIGGSDAIMRPHPVQGGWLMREYRSQFLAHADLSTATRFRQWWKYTVPDPDEWYRTAGSHQAPWSSWQWLSTWYPGPNPTIQQVGYFLFKLASGLRNRSLDYPLPIRMLYTWAGYTPLVDE